MSVTHCFVQLSANGEFDTNEQEIEVFASDQLTEDSDEQIVFHIHELMMYIVPQSISLKIILQVQVANINEARFFLVKNFTHGKNHVNTYKISKREFEVMALIAEGFINKEIAKKLCISLETVRSHRKHLLLKTGSKNTAMLIKFYDQFLMNS